MQSFHRFFELVNEADADPVETGEEAAPLVRVAPERFTGFGVDGRQVAQADRGTTSEIRNWIFGDFSICADRSVCPPE